MGTTVETGDHTTARSKTEAKYCYNRWWAPWSRQRSNGNWQTEMFGLWGVHFYRWCAPPLVMPPSASCNARHTPGTRQAHARHTPGTRLQRYHGPLEPLTWSPMVPSSVPTLYCAPSDVSWPYDPRSHDPISYNHLAGVRTALLHPDFPLSVFRPFMAAPTRP